MLKEGDIFLLRDGHDVYVENFPKVFLCDNGNFDFQPASGELHIGSMQRGLDTSIFKGQYVVTKTSYGGGACSTMSGAPVLGLAYSFPDGHHVYAKKIIRGFSGKKEVSDFEINFYQSGSFTCMNCDIKSIGSMMFRKGIFNESHYQFRYKKQDNSYNHRS